MFDDIDKIVDAYIPDTEEYLIKYDDDRDKLFELIMEFLDDRDAYVNQSNKIIDIITNNPLVVAKELSNFLYEKTDDYTITMKTTVEYKMFTITMQYVPIITVSGIRRTIDSSSEFPEELVLAEVYHKLYKNESIDHDVEISLDDVDEYAKDIKVVKRDTFKTLVNKISNRGTKAVAKKRELLEKLSEHNTIVLGYWAFRNETEDKIGTYDNMPIQLISDLSSSEIISIAKSIDMNLSVNTISSDIPNDFNLDKTRYSILGDTILEVFNSLSYEIVPYYHLDKLKVAHPFVSARFTLLEMFTFKYIVNKPHFIKMYTYLLNYFMNKEEPKESDIKFLGVIKTKMMDDRKMFYPYYPYRYFNTLGTDDVDNTV